MLIGDIQRQMVFGWKKIDNFLRQLNETDMKKEKARILNLIGANRTRIFIKLANLSQKIDLMPFKSRATRLFKMIVSFMDTS